MMLGIKKWKLKIKNWTYVLAIGYWLLAIGSFSQEIIKSKKIETADGKKYYIHIVEKGQTLYAISKEYGVSVNEIVIENPDAIDGITPGKSLRIPFNKVKKEKSSVKIDSSNFIFHKVEPKQTLYSISKNYNISIETLNSINPELKDGLKIGQVIKIPSDKKTIKDEKKKIVKEEQRPIDDLSKKPAVDSLLINKGDSIIIKSEYNVALFLPFNIGQSELNRIDSLSGQGEPDFSNKTKLAIEFYEGAKMALDSCSKLGFNGKLFIYDTDDGDTVEIRGILNRPELAQMDLIIGPIFSSTFMEVADFAKAHQIAIVSPLSQINKVLLGNIYTSKASASATTQLEQMANHVVENYSRENIIVVNNTNIKELPYVSSLQKMTNDLLSVKSIEPDSIKEVICNGKNFDIIEKSLSDSLVNIIIVPLISSQAFVTELITNLHSLHEKYKITVFGMQNWAGYDNLDVDYLNALNLHLPTNFYIDYTSSGTKKFIKKYRNLYKTEPSTYVFQGFDITLFYLKGLKEYGLVLQQQLPIMQEKGIQTAFNFYQPSIESGYENRFCYILKYKDYKLVDVRQQ